MTPSRKKTWHGVESSEVLFHLCLTAGWAIANLQHPQRQLDLAYSDDVGQIHDDDIALLTLSFPSGYCLEQLQA